MNIGSTVKWTTPEDIVVGTLAIYGKRIAIDTVHGRMEFNSGDGTVEPCEDTVALTTPCVEPARVDKAVRTGTKLEQARVIYAEMVGASRKAVIERFCAELNMTPAGASTYQALCKKAVAPN